MEGAAPSAPLENWAATARRPPDASWQFFGSFGKELAARHLAAQLGSLSMREPTIGKTIRAHPYQWLWELLEDGSTFLVRRCQRPGGLSRWSADALFHGETGTLARRAGCTERVHHAALAGRVSELSPHPILPKWLYLPGERGSVRVGGRTARHPAWRRDLRLGVKSAVEEAKARKAIKPSEVHAVGVNFRTQFLGLFGPAL